MKNHYHIYTSKHLSIELKIRHFNCFQQSIFLYNSELWTITDTQEKAIDAFHRQQLRYALGIHYPKKISNEKLYKLAKVTEWSKPIRERRIRMLGHVCRLSPETPARQSLEEVVKECKRKPGRPRTTWLSLITKDLKQMGITPDKDFKNIIQIAQDREYWKSLNRLHDGGKPSG